jgi:hypothetical protein
MCSNKHDTGQLALHVRCASVDSGKFIDAYVACHCQNKCGAPAMCDYSLQGVASRPAVVEDEIVSAQFFGTLTRGFGEVGNAQLAVCLAPGAEVVFAGPVRYMDERGGVMGDALPTVARFREIDLDIPNTHHDALEFDSGRVILVTRLVAGQKARVIQLGLQPKVHHAEPTNYGDQISSALRITPTEQGGGGATWVGGANRVIRGVRQLEKVR